MNSIYSFDHFKSELQKVIGLLNVSISNNLYIYKKHELTLASIYIGLWLAFLYGSADRYVHLKTCFKTQK